MAQLEWEYSFEKIEKYISECVSVLGGNLDHISITWWENEHSYSLALWPTPVAGYLVMPGDVAQWCLLQVAEISKYKDGWEHPENLDVLKKAGRDLYYRLRKKYPVKRNLGR